MSRIRSGRGVSAAVEWGAALWFIGYLLSVALYFLVPPSLLGWVIMPIGAVLTGFVLWRLIDSTRFVDYLVLAVAWTAIAVAADYLFIVKALHPPDGYYKSDVYLYYVLTFLLPVIAGWRKTTGRERLAQ